MPAIRTQIYLTPRQREKIDALTEREGKTLAAVVREALDAFLGGTAVDATRALESTFGALPDIAPPSRDEWDRG